jgi:hypothetical protein
MSEPQQVPSRLFLVLLVVIVNALCLALVLRGVWQAAGALVLVLGVCSRLGGPAKRDRR